MIITFQNHTVLAYDKEARIQNISFQTGRTPLILVRMLGIQHCIGIQKNLCIKNLPKPFIIRYCTRSAQLYAPWKLKLHALGRGVLTSSWDQLCILTIAPTPIIYVMLYNSPMLGLRIQQIHSAEHPPGLALY